MKIKKSTRYASGFLYLKLYLFVLFTLFTEPVEQHGNNDKNAHNDKNAEHSYTHIFKIVDKSHWIKIHTLFSSLT